MLNPSSRVQTIMEVQHGAAHIGATGLKGLVQPCPPGPDSFSTQSLTLANSTACLRLPSMDDPWFQYLQHAGVHCSPGFTWTALSKGLLGSLLSSALSLLHIGWPKELSQDSITPQSCILCVYKASTTRMTLSMTLVWDATKLEWHLYVLVSESEKTLSQNGTFELEIPSEFRLFLFK